MQKLENLLDETLHWTDFSKNHLQKLHRNSRHLLGLCGIERLEDFREVEKVVAAALVADLVTINEIGHKVEQLHHSPLNVFVDDKLTAASGQSLVAVIGEKIRPTNNPMHGTAISSIPAVRIHAVQTLPEFSNVTDIRIYMSARSQRLHREIGPTTSYKDLRTSKVLCRS